jgi:hypothetical protein
MNAIWTPQTQVAFDLISADPILINDRDKSIREEFSRATMDGLGDASRRTAKHRS